MKSMTIQLKPPGSWVLCQHHVFVLSEALYVPYTVRVPALRPSDALGHRLQVAASESMLQLIDELKSPLITNDIERNNAQAQARAVSLQRVSEKVDAGMAQLRVELADGIAELEEHYYGSMVFHDQQQSSPGVTAGSGAVSRAGTLSSAESAAEEELSLHDFPRPLQTRAASAFSSTSKLEADNLNYLNVAAADTT